MDTTTTEPITTTHITALPETPLIDTEQGDHDTFAHIVRGTRKRRAEDIVLEARINGTMIEALCGKKWIPQRDPSRFAICPTCLEIAARARAHRG